MFSTDTVYHYDDRWQVIEEHVDEVLSAPCVWSERYIDALVLRVIKGSGVGRESLDWPGARRVQARQPRLPTSGPLVSTHMEAVAQSLGGTWCCHFG
jgi:hypothetical protein